MSTGFPPLPVYPYGIDDDFTLFLVYNTTEAPLTAYNEAWSEEVPIHPQKPGMPEIWADNGFATINGEMFYYDAVGVDGNGYVNLLKRCVRNLGGKKTQTNIAGTMVRGFVMAEHHNQLVKTVLAIENFVGENFSEDEATLDWRIRHLQAVPIIFDDFDCPDALFVYQVTSSDQSAGITISYTIQITGTFNDFTLDFGDGTIAKSPVAGTHTYAPNATIDPTVTITNDQCQIVQTPIARTQANVPQPVVTDNSITLPVPVCPDIGDIFLGPISVPVSDLVIPPIIFPCLDITSPNVSLSIPSFNISINVPSVISLTPTIPSVITMSPAVPSTISVVTPSSFPSIPVAFPTPPTIPVAFPAPPTVPIGAFPAPPTIPVSFPAPPTISINWGTAPTVPINITVTANCACCPSSASTPSGGLSMAMADFEPYFDTAPMLRMDDVNLDTNFSGIPSTIVIEPPILPDLKLVTEISNIRLDAPEKISLEFTGPPIPSQIELIVPQDKLNFSLSVNAPSTIGLDISAVEKGIQLLAPPEMPKLVIDASTVPSTIQVVGLPSVIEVIHNLPTTIDVNMKMPENPTVQMLPPTEAIPISVMVTLAVDGVQKILADQAQEIQCVAILPCPR